MNGFIYLLWDNGEITCEPMKRAEAMAENKFLGPRIVKAAWSRDDL